MNFVINIIIIMYLSTPDFNVTTPDFPTPDFMLATPDRTNPRFYGGNPGVYNPRFFIVNPRPKKFSALRGDLGLLKLFNTPLSVSMGKMSYKSVRIISFFGVNSIQKNCSPHSAAPHEFKKVKICTLYHENMLSSVLLETSCYQNTLAMSLLM